MRSLGVALLVTLQSICGCGNPAAPDASVDGDAGRDAPSLPDTPLLDTPTPDTGRMDSGPDAPMGPDAPSVCGDGATATEERCDDGNTVDETECAYGTATCAGCSADCTRVLDLVGPTCGDGDVEVGREDCDDGNASTGDGCAVCSIEPGWACSATGCTPVCGDGMMRGAEACDDGNAVSETECAYGTPMCAACDAMCATVLGLTGPVCGDGTVRGGTEACDDGDLVPLDGCDGSCAVEPGWDCTSGTCTSICGDGRMVGTEVCDDGNVVTETSCPYGTATCTSCDAACAATLDLTGEVCGDGRVASVETCDDGGVAPDDGCSAGCAVEAEHVCVGAPSVCRRASPIAVPGSRITVTGAADAMDPTWMRPGESCGAGPNSTFYDATYVINDTGVPQNLAITGTWALDGFLHVFRAPYDFAGRGGCHAGDDDFDPDGPGPLGAARGSQLASVAIAPGEILAIVASSFAAATALGPYSIDVSTLVPPETNCANVMDDDLDGAVDCADVDCLTQAMCRMPVPVAPAGGTITLTGTVTSADQRWVRPGATCTAGANNTFYAWQFIENTQATPLTLTLTATWAVDGFLHVFQSPYHFPTRAGCMSGDDDFDPDGPGPLTSGRGSQLTVTILPGQTLAVVASSFSASVAIGPYSILVASGP